MNVRIRRQHAAAAGAGRAPAAHRKKHKKKAHRQVRLNGSFAASPPPQQALRDPDLAGRTAPLVSRC